MENPVIHRVFCPRCDRSYVSTSSREEAMERMSTHVDGAHPDMENYIKEED